MLDVGKVRRDIDLADPLVAHIGLEPHDWVVDGHRFGHQVDDLTGWPQLGKRKHLDESQKIPWVLRGDEPLQGQGHAFDVDVLAVVAHRSAHVHDDHGRAFGTVSRLEDLDIIAAKSNGAFVGPPEHRIGDGLDDVHIGDRVTELISLRRWQLDAPIADDPPAVAPAAGGF